jgi:hypothetical protein
MLRCCTSVHRPLPARLKRDSEPEFSRAFGSSGFRAALESFLPDEDKRKADRNETTTDAALTQTAVFFKACTFLTLLTPVSPKASGLRSPFFFAESGRRVLE